MKDLLSFRDNTDSQVLEMSLIQRWILFIDCEWCIKVNLKTKNELSLLNFYFEHSPVLKKFSKENQ